MSKRLSKKRVVIDSSAAQSTAIAAPEPEEVARLAHQFWLERGAPIGTPEEDWLRAEEEIRRRRDEQ